MTAYLRFSLALLLAACATAYEPRSGQEGKDVVWIPTPDAVVDRMLGMAKVGPGDFVIDLGSGDGRTVIAAAKRGARALGVEYNPEMVALSRRNVAREGVSARATIVNADLFETDLSAASVVTMFLLPHLNLKLKPRLLELKPGTRIVSNSFNMGDWRPDEMDRVEGEGCDNGWCSVLFWIVPARVAGTHQLPFGEVTLEQRYQILSGRLRIAGESHDLRGRVHGDEVSFSAGGKPYRARMTAGKLELY